MSVLLALFYFLAAISIYLGLLSLRGGIRFVRHLQTELAKDYPPFAPFASVFVPLRGIDNGLKENLNAIFSQDYANFEVIFVSDDQNDPAWSIVDEARRSFAGTLGPTMQTVVAGAASNCGQKVHNLSVALNHFDSRSEVFVFFDSDARPQTHSLRSLVAPLKENKIGATTGYRWFVSENGGFASHLRSVWNAAIASALGANEERNFCWGGATAISRTNFEACKVLKHWRGAASDDFAVTHALHQAGLPIKFVPQCLTPSFESSLLRELFEFTTRQLKITRVYASHLWKSVLTGSLIFVLTFFGGIALVATRAALHLSFATPLVLLLIIFAMGAMKSHLRLRAVSTIIRDEPTDSPIATLAHVTLWPIASALYLYNAMAAAVSRRVTWRGITYELKSPNETVIIQKQRSEVRDQRSE